MQFQVVESEGKLGYNSCHFFIWQEKKTVRSKIAIVSSLRQNALLIDCFVHNNNIIRFTFTVIKNTTMTQLF